MKYTKLQLEQIIQEEIQQALEEGLLDRLKSRYYGGSERIKKSSPAQLARDVAKRAVGTARYAARGEAEPHKFAGSGEYQSAKTEKAIALYREKLLDLADELENDIKKMGIDPERFGILPTTLKDLAVNFQKSLGASAKDVEKAERSARRAGFKKGVKATAKQQSEKEKEKRAAMAPGEKYFEKERERSTAAAASETNRERKLARIEKVAALKLKKGQSEEEVNKWKEAATAKLAGTKRDK